MWQFIVESQCRRLRYKITCQDLSHNFRIILSSETGFIKTGKRMPLIWKWCRLYRLNKTISRYWWMVLTVVNCIMNKSEFFKGVLLSDSCKAIMMTDFPVCERNFSDYLFGIKANKCNTLKCFCCFHYY